MCVRITLVTRAKSEKQDDPASKIRAVTKRRAKAHSRSEAAHKAHAINKLAYTTSIGLYDFDWGMGTGNAGHHKPTLYVGNLAQAELQRTKFLAGDPYRWDIIYATHEDSTPEDPVCT